MSNLSKEAKGGILLMIAAFFWGISGTVAKIIFNSSTSPFDLANMRLNLAFIIMLIYFSIRKPAILKVKKSEIKDLVILGVFGITAVQTTYYFTMSLLSVSLAIFLQFLAPILITVYCVVFMKEKVSLLKLGALILSLCGSYFIIFGSGGGIGNIKALGLITGLASAIFSAFYTLYSKKCTNKHNPWTVLVYGMGAGAILYWFVSPPWVVWSGRSPSELLFVLYIALFATIIPFGLYLLGIRYLIPTVAGVISMLEPVVASLSAFIILGENMTMIQVLGGAAVMGAVLLLQFNPEKNNEVVRKEENTLENISEQV